MFFMSQDTIAGFMLLLQVISLNICKIKSVDQISSIVLTNAQFYQLFIGIQQGIHIDYEIRSIKYTNQ